MAIGNVPILMANVGLKALYTLCDTSHGLGLSKMKQEGREETSVEVNFISGVKVRYSRDVTNYPRDAPIPSHLN